MDHLIDYRRHYDDEFFDDGQHDEEKIEISDIFKRIPYHGESGNYEITFHSDNPQLTSISGITIKRNSSEKYFSISLLSKDEVEPTEDGELYHFIVHQLTLLQDKQDKLP